MPVGGTSGMTFYGDFSPESNLFTELANAGLGKGLEEIVKYIIKNKVTGGKEALEIKVVENAVGEIVGFFSGILSGVGLDETGLDDFVSHFESRITSLGQDVPLDMSRYDLTWLNILDLVLPGDVSKELLGILKLDNLFRINEPVKVADKVSGGV